MNLREAETRLENLEQRVQLQHETLEIQLESIKLLATKIARLEAQAAQRGWNLTEADLNGRHLI